MGWEELMNELADVFTTNGIVGYRIGKVIEHEKAYSSFVEKTYKGHSILSHSFQEFYMDSLELAGAVWQEKNRRVTPPTYTETWLWHLGNFRCLRAVDILFHNGYPMDGFARLRHLKESALYLAALLTGLTTYNQVTGIEGVLHATQPPTREDVDQIRKNRMSEERRLLGLMIRKDSGLTEDQLFELGRWEGFFHQEVHGGNLTQVLEHGPAIRGEDTTSVAPKPREKACAMFINRFCEIGWMLHRTLPILQLSYRQFDEEWRKKWHLLDQNFLTMEQSLADMGKNIGSVFIEFMNVKFAFTPDHNFDTYVKQPEDSQQSHGEASHA